MTDMLRGVATISAKGLFPVFFVLLGIAVAIMYVSRNRKQNEDKAKEDLAVINTNTRMQSDDQEYDEELIAVITAAIAASLNRSTHTVIVKSVKRTADTSSLWNLAGRYDYISNKL